MRITVTRTDGTKTEFPDERRPGGSYRNKLRAEGGFLVITDAWDNETWIPSDQITDVKTYPGGR